ncbi:MAG: ABC transporter ATP-binding protein [Saprospiraceae bacterium]|nr:ABC transporter ATP-binding protein [Saprospiraceae bacterium]
MSVLQENKLKPIQRFFRLLGQEKKALANLYIFAFFAAIVSLSLPLGIQAIINLITSGQVTTSFYILILIVLIGYGLNGYLQILQIAVTEVLQRKVFAKVAFDFAFRAPRFNLNFLQNMHAPELMNRFFDTLTIQKGIPKILIDFAGSSLQISIGLILLCFYHPFFILFGFISLLLVFFIVRILSPQGLRTALKQSKYKYEVAHWLEELARIIEAFKLAGTSSFPLEQADKKTLNYLNAREAHFKSLLYHYYSILFFKIIIAGGFLLLGGLLVIDQQMNIGQFVASEIIIILMLTNAEKLIYSMDAIYDMLTALEKLGSVTDVPLEKDSDLDIPYEGHGGLKLEVKDLRYSLDEGKELIHGISFTIQPGERVMIAGHSGSGKHTLLQLLNGLYENYEGVIKYNDVSIRTLNLQKMRDKIGEILAKESIFKGTLLQNITMGHSASLEEIIEIINFVKLEGFVDTLPEGVQTGLIPEGKSLSRSIKAKILLARCLAKKPKFLMLDENINLIRTREREEILDFIYSKNHPWTVLTVGYSIEMAEKFDRIIFMKDGDIMDHGTYDEVKGKTWFKELSKNS